ncbi:MAG: hypothetical protein Q8K92_02110, partial [Leadbetterella sp.]|nr:hypothetical protein [Leadbetterella sp.]
MTKEKKVVVKKEIGTIETKELKKKLLLNKSSLDVVEFASKEQNRYPAIKGLHITENFVEATNGQILIRLSHPKFADPDDFPVTPGEPFDEINFILLNESLKGIKVPTKIHLPILSNVCLSKEGEMINVSTTDLQTMRTVKIKPEEGEFPDTENFLDKSIDIENNDEWKMFTVNSDLLKTLANYVSKRDGRDQIPITFWFKDPVGPVHFRFRFSDTEQDGRGV